jgi:hypothetical protein
VDGGLDLEAYFVRRNPMATVNTLPKYCVKVANLLTLKDEAQTASFKDPVRTAL